MEANLMTIVIPVVATVELVDELVAAGKNGSPEFQRLCAALSMRMARDLQRQRCHLAGRSRAA